MYTYLRKYALGLPPTLICLLRLSCVVSGRCHRHDGLELGSLPRVSISVGRDRVHDIQCMLWPRR